MGQVIRVSLPTYNALTDNNPDHFALYSDEDWILIKEKSRGSISATYSNPQGITHGLGYVPTVFIFFKDGNIWKSCTGELYDIVDGTKLPTVSISDQFVIFFGSNDILATDFKYFIFYDQQV